MVPSVRRAKPCTKASFPSEEVSAFDYKNAMKRRSLTSFGSPVYYTNNPLSTW